MLVLPGVLVLLLGRLINGCEKTLLYKYEEVCIFLSVGYGHLLFATWHSFIF